MAWLVGKRKEHVSTSSYNTCHPHNKLVMKRCTVAMRKCCPTTVGSRFNRNQYRHTETHQVHTLTRTHTHSDRERERHTHTHTTHTHTTHTHTHRQLYCHSAARSGAMALQCQRLGTQAAGHQEQAERKRRRLAEKLAKAPATWYATALCVPPGG